MKLNQLIAVANGKKSQSEKTVTEIHKTLQVCELFDGLVRTYQPLNDDGLSLPSETKLVQSNAQDLLAKALTTIAEVIDIVASQDKTNTVAKADIVVDGKVLVSDVPVTTMLWLEKQLQDIYTLVDKTPVLSHADKWSINSDINMYETDPFYTHRTEKQPKVLELSKATDKHPANVQVYNEDVRVGTWKNIKQSARLSSQDRDNILSRVRKLQDAVKMARELANSCDVMLVKMGNVITNYIYGK